MAKKKPVERLVREPTRSEQMDREANLRSKLATACRERDKAMADLEANKRLADTVAPAAAQLDLAYAERDKAIADYAHADKLFRDTWRKFKETEAQLATANAELLRANSEIDRLDRWADGNSVRFMEIIGMHNRMCEAAMRYRATVATQAAKIALLRAVP